MSIIIFILLVLFCIEQILLMKLNFYGSDFDFFKCLTTDTSIYIGTHARECLFNLPTIENIEECLLYRPIHEEHEL